MKKSKILALAAAAAVAGAGALVPAGAQQPAPVMYKIGYVNTDRVMRDSRVSQQAQKVLEAEFQKREKEIAAGPAGDAPRRRNALTEDIAMKRDEALKQIVDRANGIIRRLAEAEKFDLVFLEAAYASPSIDLTDKVIKALDASR